MKRGLRSKAYEPPFFSDGPATDPLYVAIRDGEHSAHERAEIEAQWARFRDFCGDDERDFLTDARQQTRQRLWEMRLAYLLMRQGHALARPPKGAPDIKVVRSNLPVWIEATIANRGEGNDAVAEAGVGLTFLKREPMMLRFTNAIDAKLKQCRVRLNKKIVLEDQPYIVAINAGSIPDADIEEGSFPGIVPSVFGLSGLQFRIPVLGAKGPMREQRSEQPEIAKQSGEPISISAFRDASAAEISAVMFTASDVRHVGMDGWDLSVVHNPFARTPLPRGTFRFGREWWYDPREPSVRCDHWRDIPRWTRRPGLKHLAQKFAYVGRRFASLRRPKQRPVSEFKQAMAEFKDK